MRCFGRNVSPLKLTTARVLYLMICTVALGAFLSGKPGVANPPDRWYTYILPRDGGRSFGGLDIGTSPSSVDGWDGNQPVTSYPNRAGIAQYHENGPAWEGPTGLYVRNFESPIPPGQSKTWFDIYLWSLNYVPSTPNRIEVLLVTEPDIAPTGCAGHLVLDYVPAEAGWTGPMDFWFDLGKLRNSVVLPVLTVSDPLQGTRFHLTVYTPEPSSLLALAAGIGGIGLGLVRKRKG